MSTLPTKFSVLSVVFLELLLFISTLLAQHIEVNLKIDSALPQIVGVEGKFLQENSAKLNRNWAFTTSSAGVENLGERISDLNLKNKIGQNVSVRKLIAGEYLADGEADFWSYKIDVNPLPQNINSMAHVSWLAGGERGILMLADLLPQFGVGDNQPISAQIKFDLPKGWTIITSEKVIGKNFFAVGNIEKAVFLVGKNWREEQISVAGSELNLAISGNFQFSGDEARQTAADIFTEYKNLFGEIPDKNIQISLVRFPGEVKFGRWEAETRGANLTILSSDMPFKATSLQRLHEQLRHEIFHLWIPNRLALKGNYEWFYEGFTVYQALRTGMKTNQIRFEDFLDTLSQAYNLDNFQTQKISLLQASKNRLSGANNQVYARGMIVAFLCDVALLRESKGKRSVSDIFQQIYKKYRLPTNELNKDGNAAVLEILSGYGELHSIVEKYIKGAEKIDWKTDLESAGIQQRMENSFVRLEIKAKTNGRQKNLLDELGYNNWRKISVKAK